MKLSLLSDIHLDNFRKNHDWIIPTLIDFSEHTHTLDLGYLMSTSSVYSAQIEGNTMDLNSYMNAELIQQKATKDKKEIDNLRGAYDFARSHILNEQHFLESHKKSTNNLLIASKRGSYRNDPMGVFGGQGLIYLAIEPEYLGEKMNLLFGDIDTLLSSECDTLDIWYYAAMIHLVFVHIHPFSDGNGRMARLLEKWFLASKLGHIYWGLQSEKYYLEQKSTYYKNINLGVNYYELDYSRSLDFLSMLPKSLVS